MKYMAIWRIDNQPIQVSYFNRKATRGVLKGLDGFKKHLEEVYGKGRITKFQIVKVKK